MSEFVAGAFVDVRPDTKGFREQLKKKVNNEIKQAGVFKVPIAFEIKAFKKQLQDAARAAKPRVPIEVGGNVQTIRKDLNAKIKKATEGLAFKVPVEFVQTGAGSRGGTGGTGGTGGAGGRGPAGDATGRRKALTEAEKQAIAVNKALDAAESKRIITEKLLASVTQQSLSAEERTQRIREARTAANAAVRTTTEALARAEGTLTDKQRIALETAQREALTMRQSVLAKEKAFKIDTAQAVASTKVTTAREAAAVAMSVEVTAVTSLNQLHIVENELLAAEAALKRATNKARELGLVSLVAENEALLANITTRKGLIVAQREELKGEGKRITQQKTGARGAASTILSMLGLRGATLAATGAFLGGAAAAAVFTKSLKSFADFEAELNTFASITGATADQMTEVSEAAKLLGEDITLPAVSAADAAVAMTELARAGLNVQDSIIGARGVLELATAAQIDNAEAATLVASGLNAFSLSGEQAVHVADLLANAANAAQGSISEMGAAMQQAAAIAHQVGISLDDTVAILTLFARNGLRGSDAGTSLRTALARLIAPTKKAADLIDLLDLNVRDLNGDIRPDIFAQFGEATADLPPALRDMAAEVIAGQDSIRAFAIGSREGARGLKLAQLQMAQTGTAAQVAAARSKGLGGSFSALASNAETLGIQLGELASGPVQVLANELNELFTLLNKIASGDFSGAGEAAVGFLEQRGKETEQRVRGIGHLFTSIVREGDLTKGLKELFGPVPKEKTRVELLLEDLDRLEGLRIKAFEAQLDIGPITKQVKEVRAELKEAKIDVGLLIPVTENQKALAPLRESLRAAQELKRELESADEPDAGQLFAVDKIIDDAKRKIRVKVKELKTEVKAQFGTGEDLAEGFRHTFELIAEEPKLATPEVLAGIDDMIRKIKNVGPGTAGRELGLKIVKSIQSAIDQAIADDDPELAAILKEKAKRIAALFGVSVQDAFKSIKIPITADDIAEMLLPERIASARAEAFGTVAEQIATKQAELAGLNKSLSKVKKGSADEEQILNDIVAKQQEIESLQGEVVSGADTKVLDALSGREQTLLNKKAVAEATESLEDDIARSRELRAFYVKQIATVRATVQDKETRNDAVADLTQKLFDLDQDIASDIRERRDQVREQRLSILDDASDEAAETESLQDDVRAAARKVAFWRKQVAILKDLVRQRKATAEELKDAQDKLDDAEDEARDARRGRRAQRRENRQERLELKIQIAADNGNVNAEIAAREAQIRNTQRLIRQTRRGSLQRLRLIAELRREQRELRELRDEKKKTNDEAKRIFFEFMQAQQGFAFNLLGNLIPGAGLGGLVGNPSPAGGAAGALPPDFFGPPMGTGKGPDGGPIPKNLASAGAAAGAAGGPAGPTRGQGATQVVLLRRIADLLEEIKRGTHAPEAKNAKKIGGSQMDVN